MEIRDVRDNGKGGLDCLINHPCHGWIPFTASEQDPDERGQKIWKLAKAKIDGIDPPVVGDDRLQPPTADELLRRARQAKRTDKLALVRNMRAAEIWDSFKAAMAKAGSDVEEDWQIAGSIARMDPVFLAIFRTLDLGEEHVDQIFGIRTL